MTVTNIIVNADDYGLSRDISDTIAKGHDRGVITSTTLLACAPATEHAANLAKLRPSLGVGIHLNITAGRPLIEPGKLTGLLASDGSFLPPHRVAKRLIFDLRLVSPIFEEYSRQVERCLDLGITPTHCDTHHGMHRFPVVFEAFKRTLLRYRIKAARSGIALVIPTQRSAKQDGGGSDFGWRWDRGLQTIWKRLCVRRMRTSGIRSPDALLRADVDAFAEVTPLGWFDSLVRHAPSGTFEIVLHPGMPEEGEHVSSEFLAIRRRDTALVDESDRLFDRLSGTAVRFISYAELARPPG